MTEAATDDVREPHPDPPPASTPSRGGWLAVAGFVLGVGSFALWAASGLPAPLVAALALGVGCVAARRSRGGSKGGGSRLARWALRLGAAHLVGWAAFVAVL